MGIINKENYEKIYTTVEIEYAIRLIKANMLTSIHCAGSGHSGGSLSAAEIVATAYLSVMRHKPHDPQWADRDRFYFSAGHKAPLWYSVLGFCGYFPEKETALLRKFGSNFQGHPDRSKLPGIEISCGSLGQGLSIAVGDAINGSLKKQSYRVFCLMGDGEQQEGQIWEAAMAASHYKLDNLVGIIDKNHLQIDGAVDEVMNIDPVEDKYKAFGWNVIKCGGNSVAEMAAAYKGAEAVKGRPTVIIAETIKGNGVSFMENQASWHGKAPDLGQLVSALKELGASDYDYKRMIDYAEANQKGIDNGIDDALPVYSKDYWWNHDRLMKVEMRPGRKGFGDALKETENESVCAIGSDISSSICIDEFYKTRPERKNRWFNMGIAEQSATALAAGLAKNGMIPFIGTYGVFSAGRALDQIRTTLCYGNFNVNIAGAHAGISVGPDGATHQALEDIYQIAGLPNMTMFSGIDAEETRKATEASIGISGPCYIRFAREATPLVTSRETPFAPGLATIIRYKGKEEPRFEDAFETVLSTEDVGGREDLSIVATGTVVTEAMRAAWILKNEYNKDVRIINISTIKPFDNAAVITAALETGAVLTVEEHQRGALGGIVSSTILSSGKLSKAGLCFKMMGIEDRFGTSGQPWELMKYFELTAEYIAGESMKLIKSK
ncbi:MAG: transketolase [Spirochaetales bacterium]|nr:transketolase [Spirochaetales bacterium]